MFEIGSPEVERWTAPVAGADSPSGPNLEHDASFLELERAVAGQEATQFGEAVPPDWPLAHRLALELMERTRDLRVMLALLRAAVHMAGLRALPGLLAMLRTVLASHWRTVHPLTEDDEDPSRLNAMAPLYTTGGLVDDVLRVPLYEVRGHGVLRGSDLLDALAGTSRPSEDREALGPAQLEQMLADVFVRDPAAESAPADAVAEAEALDAWIRAEAGPMCVEAVTALLTQLRRVESAVDRLKGQATEQGHAVADSAASDAQAPSLQGAVRSRADARRAIALVCDFFQRHEPSHPAPLLLRRAERLIDQDFMQLMADLAPDATQGVARLLGVDPPN